MYFLFFYFFGIVNFICCYKRYIADSTHTEEKLSAEENKEKKSGVEKSQIEWFDVTEKFKLCQWGTDILEETTCQV